MTLSRKLAAVRLSQAEVRAARAEVGVPVDALLARVRSHPLTSVGAAAGVGLALSQMNFHPMRVPGATGLLTSGVFELVSHGMSMFSDSGFGGFGNAGAEAASSPGQ
ncbi:hypothetical protein [Dyella sp.]|jgi:hypothetical protein|uniref:hypothetical protein n=1 Tax=Dyella sp. TaxID=1869338 RepID=UPI002D767F1B|nr:hypothetical protein [Dyella sp.]HET6431667.1 hypothetical protein [Dyella sp.]